MLPVVLEELRNRPHMILHWVTYRHAVTFLQGFDAATFNGFLQGFQEWCIVDADRQGCDPMPNHFWVSNALLPKFPEVGFVFKNLDDTSVQKAAIEQLCLQLERFLTARIGFEGLRQIYNDYNEWEVRFEASVNADNDGGKGDEE